MLVASFLGWFPCSVSFPSIGREQLRLKALVGYNGNWQANMVWRPDTGGMWLHDREQSAGTLTPARPPQMM